jgi:kynurenine formamidase
LTGVARAFNTDEYDRLFEQCKNWGRWGADDERGTLNYITPEKRARAGALVRRGLAVSCALPLATEQERGVPPHVTHYMIRAGDVEGAAGSADFIGIACHSVSITHLDALCHVFHDGRMYNDRPASLVTSAGALVNSIEAGEDGIASRGVLLDIPRVAGKEWLDLGEAIYVDDLEAAEKAQNVTVEEGDILLVNTGRHKLRSATGEGYGVGEVLAGLHASCLPWLHERGVALLGGDGVSDVVPTGWSGPGRRQPIHGIGIPAMGMQLIDNCDLGALSATCVQLNTWEFLFVVSPLRLPRGTGSPVNPIALF